MRMLVVAALVLVQGLPQASSRTAAITGRIVGIDGAPAENVRVMAMESSEDGENSDLLVSLGRTDRGGRYALEGIPPGRYFIAAGTLEHPVYFPGVFSRHEATALHLPARAAVPGVDIRLLYGTVTGRLLLTDGKPLADAEVSVVGTAAQDSSGRRGSNNRGRSPGLVLIGKTGSDGRFVIRNVPPGTYSIAAGPDERERFLPFNENPAKVVVTPEAPQPDPVEFHISRATTETWEMENAIKQLLRDQRR